MMRSRNSRQKRFGFRERGVRKHSRTVKCPFIVGNGNELFFCNESHGCLDRDSELLIRYIIGNTPTEGDYHGGGGPYVGITEGDYHGGGGPYVGITEGEKTSDGRITEGDYHGGGGP